MSKTSKSQSGKSASKPSKKKAEVKKEEAFFSLFTDFDSHLFKSGKHYKLYEKLGSRPTEFNGQKGTHFAVWAPNAKKINVMGNFNHWSMEAHPMFPKWDGSGIWEAFIPGIGHGEAYKYGIISNVGDQYLEKADPFARFYEEPPRTASIVWDDRYEWKDKKWLSSRRKAAGTPQPMAVYEMHFGSWRRKTEEDNRSLTYVEMADELVVYLKEMGYTHVEFLPLLEHPFFGSWGYQLTGFFAPTSRYGTPGDFKYLVDCLHQAGIGVIMDWVPSHFPGDAHGLYLFDGTNLFEHEDPRKGFHPDWKSYIFNYGRHEVLSFLISSALFWIEQYHIDGIRVDAVASMLYLDYSREEGEWIPNQFGGNENIDAVSFLRELNETLYGEFPDIIMIAEESTSWPMVSRPTYMGGLGFGQKWMMGWMHDTLEFFKNEPIHRKFHLNEITFSLMYAFTENFMLPLSHDEVVHGKGPLIGRMPGDEWQRFANLRMMYGLMYMHPGTKLLFMGGEFGQTSEWKHDGSLDWHLLEFGYHKGVQDWIKHLNKTYKTTPALFDYAFEGRGFQWVDYSDTENSVISFLRKGKNPEDILLVVLNFTPIVRENYRVGTPVKGYWKEIANSDKAPFGGSDVTNPGKIRSMPVKFHGKDYSVSVTLPPLGIIVLALDEMVESFEMKVS